MLLLKEALKENYSYYHLISGVDMPIKSKEEIYNFFEKNIEKQFLYFSTSSNVLKKIENRYKYYHFFPYYPRSSCKYILGIIDKILLIMQKILKINRVKKQKIKFFYGAQWFSITDTFANYILSKEKWIKDTFKYTSCCDEIFLQTLIMNSNFKENLYDKEFNNNYVISIKRYIDWKRGNPYILKKEDFNDLINSEALFARKFDLKIDKEIINMLFKKIYKKIE